MFPVKNKIELLEIMYDHHILWLSVFSHVNNTQKDRFSRCKWYENNFCIKCFQQILAPGTCFKHHSRGKNNQFILSRMTNDRHLIFSALTGSFVQNCTSTEKLLLSISFPFISIQFRYRLRRLRLELLSRTFQITHFSAI